MEGSMYSGRHVQWAGGTYWAGGMWVNGELGGQTHCGVRFASSSRGRGSMAHDSREGQG